MARPCTVCGHSDRAEIERAVVTGELSRAAIAATYGVSGAALSRHVAGHMTKALAKAKKARDKASEKVAVEAATKSQMAEMGRQMNVLEEFQTTLASVAAMRDACLKELGDPKNPGELYLGPRAEDIEVVYLVKFGEVFIKDKATLAELLARIEEKSEATAVAVQIKSKDTKDLLLSAIARFSSMVSTMAKIQEELMKASALDPARSEQWQKMRHIILEELAQHPDVRMRIVERLRAAEEGE